MADSADMRDELQPSRELMVDAFAARWQSSAASERSNYQLFLIELCEVLGVGDQSPRQASPSEISMCSSALFNSECRRIDQHGVYRSLPARQVRARNQTGLRG